MPRGQADIGAKELHVWNDAHKALLQKAVRMHTCQIKNTVGDDMLVARGMVLAIRYLLSQEQGWDYGAMVQLHVAAKLRPKPTKQQLNTIMRQMVYYTSPRLSANAAQGLIQKSGSRTQRVTASR